MNAITRKKMQDGSSWGKRFLATAAVLLSTTFSACTYNTYICPAKAPKHSTVEKEKDRYFAAMEVLAKCKHAFTNIYERALKRDPELKGKLEVTLSINKDGWVENVSFKGKMNEEINRKYRMLFMGIKFAPADKGMTIRFPIMHIPSQSI